MPTFFLINFALPFFSTSDDELLHRHWPPLFLMCFPI
ncbi:Uncharacterized protein APZ42_029712 [Daphnia magna]|uniref:Uncharacterized protein n=1 Tax=Daphnia magna TaxID=35525 RepID=A0A164PE83_9CRUS|nr:Uncharacterized protein APZ42_029712 [Daphnia magna]